MQDRQHDPVSDGIEKLVGLPGSRQRTGLGLTVADHAGDDQTGIVERGTEGMAERVSEFAAFVNRAWRGRGDVAGNPTGKRELREQLLESGLVLGDVRIDFTPSAFEIDVAHNSRSAVTRTGDVEHVQVVLLDYPIQVNVDEILSRRCAPMPDDQRLHVRKLQGIL